jgi:hypothetical protein
MVTNGFPSVPVCMLWSSLQLPALVAYKQLKDMFLSLESMFKELHLLHRTPFLKIECMC